MRRHVAVAVLLCGFFCSSAFAIQPWDGIPGGFIHFGQPGRAAVLLFHGLGSTGDETWRRPEGFGVHWDYTTTTTPNRSLGTGGGPRAGFESVQPSAMLSVNSRNLFQRLVDSGFTVAIFDQASTGGFAGAVPGAITAFNRFVNDTDIARTDFVAAPPIALIGHSRGGLVIREVLKQAGARGRVRWAITLHSPHTGSDGASFASRCATDFPASIDLGNALNPWRDSITAGVRGAMAPLDALLNSPSQAELIPNGPVITSVEAGEAKLPFVRYVTFGGTSPTYLLLFLYAYTPASAAPIVTFAGFPATAVTTFTYTSAGAELAPLSPLLNRFPPCIPEVTVGRGDGLVSDARSHISFEDRHVTNALNHAEVLWTTGVQATIIDELLQPLVPIPIEIRPRVAVVGWRQIQQFRILPRNIVNVRWAVVRGGGQIDQSGVYTPPRLARGPRPRPRAVEISATALDDSNRVATLTFTLGG